ncbi:MAG: 2 protein [Patescibacteria group bacterium]|nr:2 protein [Patescibacteria group bacterium]
MSKEKIVTVSIFAIIIASSFFFGFSRLKDFSGVDEPYWFYDRVPKFWNAVADGKWKSTHLCDKPGIGTAIVSGAGLPFIKDDPRDFEKLRYREKTPEQVEQIRQMYFFLRLPMFLFTLLSLPFFYFLIKKLSGESAARFSAIFMGLSPVLLGISLIINTDSVLWILTALSTLNLFVFFKTGEKKYLILSGVLLGFSVISKFVANVLFVYFFLLFLLEYIFYAHNSTDIKKYLKQASVNYLTLFSVALLTAFIFFPAAWVKFSLLMKYTLAHEVFSSTWPLYAAVVAILGLDVLALKGYFSQKTFGFFVKYKNSLAKIIGAIFVLLTLLVFLHVYAGANIFDIQGLIASPKGIGEGNILVKYSGAVTADLYSFLFSISPLVLLSLLLSVFYVLKNKDLNRDLITVVYIIIFALMFYLGSAINEVTTTVRYQIMVYPLAFMAAAIGLKHFFESEKVAKILPLWSGYVFSIIVLISSLYFIKPHFLAYASEILPKDNVVNLKGMGEGSLEAAYYLNSLPGAGEMTIWSDKGAVCEAFVGRCFIDFKRKTFSENDIKYFVVSTDRKSRTVKLSQGIKIVDEEKKRAKESIEDFVNFENLYAEENPKFEVIIGGREVNFVKVIKKEDMFSK